MYKLILFLLLAFLGFGCALSHSVIIPRSSETLDIIQKYNKINVALVNGKKKHDASNSLFLAPLSAFDHPLIFTLDASEANSGTKILSPNISFTNNLTQHLQTQISGLKIQNHKDLDLMKWENRKILLGKGLWMQSVFIYTPISGYYEKTYTLRGFVYLFEIPSKKILWQGVCRKWYQAKDEYHPVRQEYLKTKIQSFIQYCSAELIAQWNGKVIESRYIRSPECIQSQQGCLFGQESMNGISFGEGVLRPPEEFEEMTPKEKEELKRLLQQE